MMAGRWVRDFAVRRVLFFSFAAAALAPLCCWPAFADDDARETPPASTAEERRATFEWFGGLGLDKYDVKNAPFVRVATGNWTREGNDPPRNSYKVGFLLEENENKFRVLDLTHSEITFTKTPDGVPEHERVGYDPIDLAEFVRDWFAELDALEAEPAKRDVWRRFGERLSERGEILTLAWGCWRRENDELAAKLYDRAATMTSWNDEQLNENIQSNPTFRQRLEADFGHSAMWGAVLAFENTDVSREELQALFERIVERYPSSLHVPRAKATAAILASMAREDKEHAARQENAKPFEELSKQEQIAELIFQLRDQNGYQWSQPGACDIFLNPGGDEDTPAHRLVEMSYDAVPQLIAALDDNRLCRSVGYHRNFYFSHHVLTIGDCAEAILRRIAGRPFYARTYTAGYMSKDGEAPTVKQMVEAWYGELQTKGEKQLLLDEVAAGDEQSGYSVARLAEKYPDAAVPAIIAGLQHAEDGSWEQRVLMVSLRKLPGEESVQYLRGVLESETPRSTRLLAARILHWDDHPEGLAAILAEWRKAMESYRAGNDEDELSGMADFLIESLNTEAIRAVEKDFESLPLATRMFIVRTLGDDSASGLLTGAAFENARRKKEAEANADEAAPSETEESEAPEKEHPPTAERREAVNAMMDILLKALDDTEPEMGSSGNWGGKSYADPRVCDIAGHVLYMIHAEEYPFDLAASRRDRDRLRVVLKNAWRSSQGLPALPLPAWKPRVIEPAAPERLQPLLAQFANADDDASRQAAAGEIEKLGLGALGGVLESLDALPDDAPHREALAALAQRLDSTVIEIKFTEQSAKPSEELAARLQALQGKPLDPRALAEILAELAAQLKKPLFGFLIVVDREAEEAGIALTVELFDSLKPRTVAEKFRDERTPDATPHSWRIHDRVRMNGRVIKGSSWGNPTSKAFAELLQSAADAPARQSLEIYLRVIGQWDDNPFP